MLAPPDLVVLDLGRPDVDGTDVLREIHAAGRPPVLVLTARSTGDARGTVLAAAAKLLRQAV